MIKAIFFIIIGFLILMQFVNPSMMKAFDFSKILLKVEEGLVYLLESCEKIDTAIFEPIKIKFIPGYIPKNPPEEPAYSPKAGQAQPVTVIEEPNQLGEKNTELGIEEKFVKLTLKTGFTAKGKLLDKSNGRYTIEMDGYPVIFTEAEIQSIQYTSE